MGMLDGIVLPQELSDVLDTPYKALWIALLVTAVTLIIGAFVLGVRGRRRRNKQGPQR